MQLSAALLSAAGLFAHTAAAGSFYLSSFETQGGIASYFCIDDSGSAGFHKLCQEEPVSIQLDAHGHFIAGDLMLQKIDQVSYKLVSTDLYPRGENDLTGPFAVTESHSFVYKGPGHYTWRLAGDFYDWEVYLDSSDYSTPAVAPNITGATLLYDSPS
ncbi:hypothetical protein F5144DRAFT_308406 [Chaetomium tenue]|uniref:Uncharacterized protein n=1 Tax=Chaetomium tenue TaxID=1854479 RepID=A0ACB7P3K0_9PEZI|nr:hypothetical protein F5144DRAFT_308406 [Chaetomium globosum]